jgi:4-hydroxy-2-oxoheptanedioate aldolase
MNDALPGSLRERLKSGSILITSYQFSLSAATAESVGQAGFDLAFVDCQHGPFDRSDVIKIIAGLHQGGTSAMVRPLNDDQATIGWMFDAGAAAVLVPMVSTREQAERIVAACRYQPAGVRSWGLPLQPTFKAASAQDTNRRVICGVIIESKQGLENVEAIAAVDGLDFILFGAADLALSLEIPMAGPAEWLSGDRLKIVERFLKACKANRIAPAVFTATPETSKQLVKLGFQILMVTAEGPAAAQMVAAHRAAL